jgi:hypothetical protein
MKLELSKLPWLKKFHWLTTVLSEKTWPPFCHVPWFHIGPVSETNE